MIFHLGAISSTTETDGDLVIKSNFELSSRLWQWCSRAAGAPRLCLVGGNLRRRIGRLRRFRSARRARSLAAAQSIWLVETFVRPLGGPPGRARRGRSAAVGRGQVLQRLWAQRISQGLDEKRRRPSPSARCAGRSCSAVQVLPPRLSRRRPTARFRLRPRLRRRDALAGRNADGFGTVQHRVGQGPQLSRSGSRHDGRARPRAARRIHRHARNAARQISIFHRGRSDPAARRPAIAVR